MLNLRRAAPEDSADVLRWRNDPVTIAASLSRAEVDLAEHEKWYASVLDDPARVLLIAEDRAGKKIGLVRFDKVASGFAEISINLAPEMRGQGYGAILIEKGCRQLPDQCFIARVKVSNLASISVFKKAGFTELFSYQSSDIGGVLVMGLGGDR